jgi:ribosomal protein S27AE
MGGIMKSKNYKELKITGITFTRRVYMDEDMTHYFGFDEDGEIIKEATEPTMMFSLGGTKEEFENFISRAIEDINILSWKNEYRPTETVLDGEEWKITIHVENDDDIEIFGINAYPGNFVDFIVLCTEFNFGPYDLVDDETSYDLGVEEWYDDFLEEIEELESKLLCPKCSSDYMVHTDPMGYTFLCGDCGNVYEYEDGKFKAHFEFEKKANEE